MKTTVTGNNNSLDNTTDNETSPYKKFYLLSPDGFTLDIDAPIYTSIEDAKSDYEKWVKRYSHQGYYSSCKYGRIPLDKLWDFMIIHDFPFFDVNR